MSLPVLFNRVYLLVLSDHNLIKVDFVVKKVIKLEALKGLEHLVNLILELLYQVLVLDPKLTFGQQCILLIYPHKLLV
jgi:hypothetical protein